MVANLDEDWADCVYEKILFGKLKLLTSIADSDNISLDIPIILMFYVYIGSLAKEKGEAKC